MIQDVLVGALGAFTTSEIPLSASSHALLPIIAGRAEIVIENAFLHEHTRILATTDSLTGLLNRRVFREGIVREFERSKRLQMYRRSGGDLSVIMLDVDHFKNFNDTYGHQLGDKVLKMVASVLMSIARRATDMVARYGGEEFVMIAPDTSLENARIIAERVRQTLQDTAVESAAGPLHVTASFGVSTYPQCGATSIEALIEQADGAQYRAKNGGRNRVETAPLLHENDDLADTQSS
jgi:diguanylate cyclase (GGDEF)-like protein